MATKDSKQPAEGLKQAAQDTKNTYTKEQIEQMCQVIAVHKSELVKLKEGTRSAYIIDNIHKGLLAGDQIEVKLKGAKQVNGYWESPVDLEGGWAEAVEKLQNAEETIRSHRMLWGWVWFCAFALALLGVVALYIILHLRWEPTEPNIFLWTAGRAKVYAEVAFWAFFGLLTWTVYSVQHWVRQGEDISRWSQWYISKALQGVPIAIVIVLIIKEAFDQVEVGTAITNKVVPVVMGFILGYYSDRARDYLDRIRDKLFTDPAPPELEISLPEDGFISRVPKTVVRGRVTRGEAAQAKLAVNNGEPKALAVDGNGNFADLIELSQGMENLVVVQVENLAKRTGSKAVTVKYPGPKPVVVVNGPTAGKPVSTPAVTISGTVKDAGDIPFAGRGVLLLREGALPTLLTVNQRGEFSQEVKLVPGPNTIRVAALHEGGMVSAELTVQFDKPAENAAAAGAGAAAEEVARTSANTDTGGR